MTQNRQEPIRSFRAISESGIGFIVHCYEPTDGFPELQTSHGLPVRRKGKGHYEIVLRIGTIAIRSNELEVR